MAVFFDYILNKLRVSDRDPALEARVLTLENNYEYYIYFAEISGTTGTITIPTGATIVLDQFQEGADAFCSTIINDKPTLVFPQTSGGTPVDVTSFNSGGAFVINNTPSAYPIALIYILKIKAKDQSNLDENYIVEEYPIDSLAAKKDRTSELITGGTITVGTYGGSGSDNDTRVTASTYFILNYGSYSAAQTDFLDIALSSAGLQRWVGFYGTTSGTVSKVEGSESEYAVYPSQPANTALIGYVLVTDAAYTPAPALDLSAYATINPRVYIIASSATPTLNIDLYDEFYITALASAITSMTSGLSGTYASGRNIVIKIKDNGTIRAITWGAKFATKYATLPTTTIVGKDLIVGLKYNISTNVFECWVVNYSI